jgi:phage-related protein
VLIALSSCRHAQRGKEACADREPSFLSGQAATPQSSSGLPTGDARRREQLEATRYRVIAPSTIFDTLQRMTNIPPILSVRFFRTDAGNEPVREWLTDLPKEHKRLIGTDIKTVQFGWPIGMPMVRKLDNALWEVRTTLGDTIARVIFTVVEAEMVLLHGFIKKSQKTPAIDLQTAKQRKARL